MFLALGRNQVASAPCMVIGVLVSRCVIFCLIVVVVGWDNKGVASITPPSLVRKMVIYYSIMVYAKEISLAPKGAKLCSYILFI